jgi:hypothetical protein
MIEYNTVLLKVPYRVIICGPNTLNVDHCLFDTDLDRIFSFDLPTDPDPKKLIFVIFLSRTIFSRCENTKNAFHM